MVDIIGIEVAATVHEDIAQPKVIRLHRGVVAPFIGFFVARTQSLRNKVSGFVVIEEKNVEAMLLQNPP